MTKYELMQLALKNARSHCPITKLTAKTQAKLQDAISFFEMETEIVIRLQKSGLIYLTSIILDDNGYTGRERTFCSSGLNCDCDIPCGA